MASTTYADKLGFGSSWKMLTRDKGWLKPVLVLTLVAWIPIVGQIAVLGYAYEWARLTAWGVDAAPKQHGVDLGRMLSSGARAFGVTVLMGIAISMVAWMVPGLGIVALSLFTVFGPLGVLAAASGGLLFALSVLAVGLLATTFVGVCAMRAVLYDRFSAGWRLDRVFQMIARDFGGFLHVFAVSLVAGIVPALVMFACILVCVPIALAVTASIAVSVSSIGAAQTFLSMGFAPVVLVVIAAILVVFALSALMVAMSLVWINAVGQWFNRFDVRRWGTSSAPLPADVPTKGSTFDADSAPRSPYVPTSGC